MATTTRSGFKFKSSGPKNGRISPTSTIVSALKETRVKTKIKIHWLKALVIRKVAAKSIIEII